MQNKNSQTNKAVRRLHERVGAFVLMSVTLFGLASISHSARSLLKEAALKPSIAIITNSGRENETARLPVRYDSVLKLQTIGGQ